MNRRTQLHPLPLVLILLLAVTASAQNYDLTWSTIDGGGIMSSTGGTFDLSGTIGQPDAASNPTLTGGTFELLTSK